MPVRNLGHTHHYEQVDYLHCRLHSQMIQYIYHTSLASQSLSLWLIHRTTEQCTISINYKAHLNFAFIKKVVYFCHPYDLTFLLYITK